MKHDDQIRVGYSFISIINTETESSRRSNAYFSPIKVTDDLILESIEQYGVLLHVIGQRLVYIPDLDNALIEISALISRLIGAEMCQIFMEDDFKSLSELGISISFAQKIIENNLAIIFSSGPDTLSNNKIPITQPIQSMLIAPVIIDQKVVALIFARKSTQDPNPFNYSDLHLVLSVSNQVVMSIQRSKVESKLIHVSSHDSLTDLPNRALFLERLNWSITRAKQEKGFEFAVLFFDIDDFKIVNDSLGHGVGDKLLIAVAERLKHNVRNLDINTVIARFGGDEFAILLDNIQGNLFALATAKRLKDILSKPYRIDEKQIFSTVSIGVTVSSIGYENPDDILRDADMAMYQAKGLGKARVEIDNKAMQDRGLEHLNMGTALRQGVLRKELRSHYQPIISLKTGYIVGYEALLRWYVPERGILYPADFMYAIDTAGLIYSTDHQVIYNACMQAVEWQNRFMITPPIFVSVNLSAKNLKHPNLTESIKRIIKVTNLDSSSLHLEITEKVNTLNDENAIKVLKNLRSIGIHISLDDFVAEYSTLNYLARMPIDVLKIDRSFIKIIGENNNSQKVIEMIKTIANH